MIETFIHDLKWLDLIKSDHICVNKSQTIQNGPVRADLTKIYYNRPKKSGTKHLKLLKLAKIYLNWQKII